MKAWKTAALVAALLSAGGLGAAFAPMVHGQTAIRARTAPRAFQMLTGRGGQIGVSIRDVDEDVAKTNKMPSPAGVVIEDVTEDSPAEKAGLKKGDVVVEFDGERIRSVKQFTRLVQETPAGRKVQAAVMRDGRKVDVTVEPRESDRFRLLGDYDTSVRALEDLGRSYRFDLPTPARPAMPTPPVPPAAPLLPDIQRYIFRSGNSLGMTVGDLSSQLADYFGTKDGVLVTAVTADSAAAKAGLKAGDVITEFNGSTVGDPSDLRRSIQRLSDGDEFTIGVMRDRKPMTLKGKSDTRRSGRTFWTIL
jgi:serine protease Do